MAVTSFSQTTQQKLDKIKDDPKRIENAAKADIRLIDKKDIVDSAFKKNAPAKRNEPGCKFKKKNKFTLKS
jgi:hypothetical protein